MMLSIFGVLTKNVHSVTVSLPLRSSTVAFALYGLPAELNADDGVKVIVLLSFENAGAAPATVEPVASFTTKVDDAVVSGSLYTATAAATVGVIDPSTGVVETSSGGTVPSSR